MAKMKKAQSGESLGKKSLREGQVKRVERIDKSNPERAFKVAKRMVKRAEPMMKNGGSKEFGMLSVKAGVDKNPKPTAADRIAGAKGMAKSGKKVAKKMMKSGGTVSMQLGSYDRQIGKNYTGKNVVNKGAKAKMGKSVGKCKNGC
jgi:hypothetical protein